MTHVMRTLGDRAYFATHERGQYEQPVAQAVWSSDQPDRTAAFDRASSPFRFAQRTSSGRPRGGTALRVGTVAPDRFASGRRAPTAKDAEAQNLCVFLSPTSPLPAPRSHVSPITPSRDSLHDPPSAP